MKRFLLILTAMFSSAISGCGGNAPKFYDGVPKSYEYTYDVCMAFPARWYKVFTDEEGTLCLAYNGGGPDAIILRAPGDILENVGKIARDRKLYKLDRHYDPPFQVLDGYSWHLDIEYDGGAIWSGGNNEGPGKELSEGIDAINEYLEGIIASAGEEDTIGREGYREFRR